MLFYSTAGKIRDIPFKEAVLQGVSQDGGLFLPQNLPTFSLPQLWKLRGLSFFELCSELAKVIFKDEWSAKQLEDLCIETFNLPVPFFSFPNHMHLLELFHGPSLSFKDFGARFLGAILRLWRENEVTVLVATSGDTGSAVGMALGGIPGVKVYVLFPKGHVTPTQKQQLTTLGPDVKAIEIEGSFESCQEMVRQALQDKDLLKRRRVTTGNSLNIARLFPQAFYYFYAYSQLTEHGQEVIWSVPCGNFGHLVSGMLAKKMGLPVHKFLAATNINNEVPLFLRTGVFEPHEAYHTLAVSMDVGNPSNFPRLLALHDHSLEKMRHEIHSESVTDAEILEAIKEVYESYGYVLDPHSATAYRVLRDYVPFRTLERPGVFFATAHPSKFKENLSSVITQHIHTPEKLASLFSRPQRFFSLPASYNSLKDFLY